MLLRAYFEQQGIKTWDEFDWCFGRHLHLDIDDSEDTTLAIGYQTLRSEVRDLTF